MRANKPADKYFLFPGAVDHYNIGLIFGQMNSGVGDRGVFCVGSIIYGSFGLLLLEEMW